jgi:hypothetical protein
MNSDFFYRPLWQQYCLCFLSTLAIFAIGYLFFINDLANQVHQKTMLFYANNQNIEQLKVQLARYQTDKPFILISEQDFAKAIKKNHLTLGSFKHYQMENTANWDIELYGQFNNLINLITYFNENYFYLDFKNLDIYQEDNYLKISFTLVLKKEIA